MVTGFEFDLHPVGPDVATCLVFYPGDRLREVLSDYREFVADAQGEISTLVFAGELPEEELFPADRVHERKFAITGCYAGPAAEGERALAPLRKFDEPLADCSGVRSYTEFQRVLDGDYPDGMRCYWTSLYLDALSASAIDRIAYWADAAPSPLSTVDVWQLGGAIGDTGVEESAFAGRHAPFLLGVETNWEDPRDDDANVEWARDCIADIRGFSDGSVSLNFLEDEDETMRTTFGPTDERLVALTDEYDPTNRFDSNQNVKPTA